MSSLLVPARFNGPPRSGNGGWTAGALAALLDVQPSVEPSVEQGGRGGGGAVVQVRLTAPPPLDVELLVQAGGSGLTLSAGDTAVARASVVPDPFTDPPPAPVDWEQAAATAPRYRGHQDHPFPTCFACGPQRPAHDGLHLQPGVLPDQPGTTACTWTPDPSLAAPGQDVVPLPVAWAALDCPGGWSVDLAGRPMVLGTMTARVEELPRIGARHVVLGQVLDLQGRKAWTETALYAVDPAPRLLGRATAVWIAVPPGGDDHVK